ncbi:MAG: tRNA pseudouridine(55) synthase TruB [Capsulimonas sp.]|uniref:tRNA pseudouridine(55) synthase TruB n=1 Tax=Capsulimonas sp. TaxID=2494211 RepID=UPI0032652A71
MAAASKPKPDPRMVGVLNVDKPAGMTSHDVVYHIRRAARVKQVGHAGTLDPDATGVLLVCVGPATRIAEYLADQGKAYRAVIQLGSETDTEDASGQVLSQTDASHITREDLEKLLPDFMGEISQIPPMVSAVHHEGKRLYELARAGITVEREARTIRIDSLAMSDFAPGPNATAILDVECGKGTYIRTLCADIGKALGVGGHMASLRRTAVGAFHADSAAPLETITPENVLSLLTPASEALRSFPMQSVDDARRADILHGRTVPTELADTPIVRVVDANQQLVALALAEAGALRPFKVFSTEHS